MRLARTLRLARLPGGCPKFVQRVAAELGEPFPTAQAAAIKDIQTAIGILRAHAALQMLDKDTLDYCASEIREGMGTLGLAARDRRGRPFLPVLLHEIAWGPEALLRKK